MARIKTVFTPSELPHIWARQTQEEGRTQSNNFYFNGATIYSYGRHFPIAKIIPSGVVLMTWRSYSNTTAKHIRQVDNAVSHMEKVECYNPEGPLTKNMEREAERIAELKSDVENTRKRPHTRAAAGREIDRIMENCRKICIAYGTTLSDNIFLLGRSIYPKDHVNVALFNWALDRERFDFGDAIVKIDKGVGKAQAKAKKEREKNAAKNLKLWLAGELSTYNLYDSLTPVMLRLRKDEDMEKIVETTKGARVSYDAAKLLYSMIKAGKDIKGHNIDGYTVISLNGVLKIGCHEIPRAEVDRFAKLMNW